MILLAFAVVVGVPFAMRPPTPPKAAGDTLIIVTPHVMQIRVEFERAFDRWRFERTGRRTHIDWRTPGGTTEILKQLEAQYAAAIKSGTISPEGECASGAVAVDIAFGGGSYDHGRLKRGVQVAIDAGPEPRIIRVPMSVPAGFTSEELEGWFGPRNEIGAQLLYDSEQFWIGVALSSFGIVYNREVFARLGLAEPSSFEDLARPELRGQIALADPRQSGSVTTTLDSILSHYGWDKGWRLLRELCANTRYFTNSSTKPPIDVSQGEAAAALAIDFYGRGQAQAVLAPGQSPQDGRVGYVDPPGSVSIDADPISILRGGPNPELARDFVRFCLSDEGQALWNFASRANPRSRTNPAGAKGEPLGPERHELRRLPIRREFYERFGEHLIDRIDPYTLASQTRPAGWRDAIPLMMGKFGIDNADELRSAWSVLLRARRDPRFPPERLAEMERHFYAFPVHEMPDGKTLEFTPENFRVIRESWRDARFQQICEIRYARSFRESYARVVELGREREDRR